MVAGRMSRRTWGLARSRGVEGGDRLGCGATAVGVGLVAGKTAVWVSIYSGGMGLAVVLALFVDVIGREKDGEHTSAVTSSGRRSARRRRGRPTDVGSGRRNCMPKVRRRRIYEEEEGGKKGVSEAEQMRQMMGEKGRLCQQGSCGQRTA